MSECATCKHPEHVGRCDYPITEDIYVGHGTYDPVGYFWGSQIVATCDCGLIEQSGEGHE